jgi:hypothetical protein
MRQAKSYSIVDHEFLHGGFLARLSHAALALYLFLCVVGDRDGRSFYGDRSICEILRLSFNDIAQSRSELIGAGLIHYRFPYWHVRSLTKPACASRAPAIIPKSRPREDCGMQPVRGVVPEALKALLQGLEEDNR